MPRAKPSKVEVLRFELGTKERQLLGDAITAYQVNKISTPIVALLSDVSALSALTLGYLFWRYDRADVLAFMKTTYTDLADLVTDTLTFTRNNLPVIDIPFPSDITMQDIENFIPNLQDFDIPYVIDVTDVQQLYNYGKRKKNSALDDADEFINWVGSLWPN